MEADLREQVLALAPDLRRRLRLSGLIVFGSRARGDSRPDSDTDVAVVSSDFEDLRRLDRLRLCDEDWPPGFQAIPLTPRELESLRKPIVWEVVADGIPLLDDGTFARAQERLKQLIDQGDLRREPDGWRFRWEVVDGVALAGS